MVSPRCETRVSWGPRSHGQLEDITRVPANVPRELTGVKGKAHNMLWISALDHMMSHPLCSYWPKYTCEGYLRGRKKGQS
jgi:hypothetical protein